MGDPWAWSVHWTYAFDFWIIGRFGWRMNAKRMGKKNVLIVLFIWPAPRAKVVGLIVNCIVSMLTNTHELAYTHSGNMRIQISLPLILLLELANFSVSIFHVSLFSPSKRSRKSKAKIPFVYLLISMLCAYFSRLSCAHSCRHTHTYAYMRRKSSGKRWNFSSHVDSRSSGVKRAGVDPTGVQLYEYTPVFCWLLRETGRQTTED